MRNEFYAVAEAAAHIAAGRIMLVAGSPALLAALPPGHWIGGSTPYFMTAQGGLKDDGKLFCTMIDEAQDCRIDIVPAGDIARVLAGRFAQGFSYVLVPAFTAVHERFAIEAPDLPDLFQQPLVGWVTGVDLLTLGQSRPVAVDGRSGKAYDEMAVVMHVALDEAHAAEAGIVNLFRPGLGDEIVFPHAGFSAETCYVNGTACNFAAYLREAGADTALPLVSDYTGALINVSFQSVVRDRVEFYAPVVAGRVYRLAAPVGDYAAAYAAYCAALRGAAGLSFNCILNYQYAALEGRTTGGFTGPVTFGEIAYMLLNQTLVQLEVKPLGARLGQTA
jgi:hypothetical protein